MCSTLFSWNKITWLLLTISLTHMLTGFLSLININECSNSFFPCLKSYGSVFWFTGFVLLCFRGLFHLVNSDSVVLMSLPTAIASNSTVFSDIITPFFCTYTTFILIVMAVLLLFLVASTFLELGIKEGKYVKICIQHKHKILILIFLMSSNS